MRRLIDRCASIDVGQALLVVCVGGRHRLTKLSARMSKTIGELVEECRAERRGEQRLGGGPSSAS